MAENNRNLIPLVLAVLLALSAVVAVRRFIGHRTPLAGEEFVSVVVAARPLNKDELVNDGAIRAKRVPRSALPPNAILWGQSKMILNQKIQRAVMSGSYIELDDIGVGGGLSDMVGEGEWAIPISLNGGAITNRLRPGDEIAIIATFSPKNAKNDSKGVGTLVTTVLLPQVRILALDGNQQQGGDQFVLALSPQYAQMLLSAQAQGVELSPALRRPRDTSNLNRVTTGMVDSTSFDQLLKGVDRVVLPEVPGNK